MFQSITSKTFLIVAGAAFVSGVLVILTSAAPPAKAAPVQDALQQSQSSRPSAAGCSSQSWPHYERGCQFDLRGIIDDGRTVRIIAFR